MRVYHFINSEYGIEDIQKRRLKVSNIMELNDPFEFYGLDLSNKILLDTFNTLKSKISEKYGILCFSKCCKNPVQWSHYADKHKGLCLGFDIPDNFLQKINYSPEKLKITVEMLLDKNSGESLLQTILSTKHKHWEYENEVRSMIPLEDTALENELYFESFSNNLTLKEIIIGVMSSITHKDLINILGNMSDEIIIKKAKTSNTSFEII